jgi:RNA polymerase sigma-70 factor (ECF subfamily)
MKAETEDLRLARQVAAGNEGALERFYALHADPLFAFILHRLDGSRPDAEDAWQETLMAALHGIGSYEGDSRLFTWLCGIARHKIADLRRRGARGESLASLGGRDLSALVDTGPLPEEIVMQRAVRSRVVEALGLLPPDYRAALIARYADHETVGEVARRIGKGYKATESLLSRAKAALRVALDTLDADREPGSGVEATRGRVR